MTTAIEATNRNANIDQVRACIRKLDRAIESGDDHKMASAISYGAQWLAELGAADASETMFARLGRTLGLWYGDPREDVRAEGPSVFNLMDTARVTRVELELVSK